VVDCELEEEKLAPGVMVSPEKLWLKLFSEWTCRSTSSMKDSEKEKRSWMFDDGGGWLLGGLFLRSRAGIDSLCEGMVGAGLCDKGLLFCCCGRISLCDFALCIYSTYRPSPPRRPLALSLDCSTLL